MIFATFNAVAFIHMFLTAYETKGKTLEEMDAVFDSVSLSRAFKMHIKLIAQLQGKWAWQKPPKESRLDQLAHDIEEGKVKVVAPHLAGGTDRLGSVDGIGEAEKAVETTEAPKV